MPPFFLPSRTVRKVSCTQALSTVCIAYDLCLPFYFFLDIYNDEAIKNTCSFLEMNSVWRHGVWRNGGTGMSQEVLVY